MYVHHRSKRPHGGRPVQSRILRPCFACKRPRAGCSPAQSGVQLQACSPSWFQWTAVNGPACASTRFSSRPLARISRNVPASPTEGGPSVVVKLQGEHGRPHTHASSTGRAELVPGCLLKAHHRLQRAGRRRWQRLAGACARRRGTSAARSRGRPAHTPAARQAARSAGSRGGAAAHEGRSEGRAQQPARTQGSPRGLP